MSIDREMLGMALTYHGDGGFFFDRETGDVIPDVEREIDSEDPRYLAIDPLPSRLAYDLMVEFCDELSEGSIKERLSEALAGMGAFRRFKDVFFDYPKLRAMWFEREAAWIDAQVSRWLWDHELTDKA